MYAFIPVLSGLLFGAGMVISGMVDPNKVLAFLDVTGEWQVDLAFVIGGALAVFMPMYHFVIKPKAQPLDNTCFNLSKNTQIDAPLTIGSILFGVGWGLAGICPGPALSSLSSLNFSVISFIITMLIGMKVMQWLKG